MGYIAAEFGWTSLARRRWHRIAHDPYESTVRSLSLNSYDYLTTRPKRQKGDIYRLYDDKALASRASERA